MAEILLTAMAFFNALGLLLVKRAAAGAEPLVRKFRNRGFLAGLACLSLSPLFMVIAARFCTLSRMNAFSSFSYIFIIILSALLLREKIDARKIVGSICIVAGLLLLK